MTCQPIAVNAEKVISVWLDVMLLVLIPLGTRRPLQVLWMRRIRSSDEVKHRLLLQSGLSWTTGMTGRNEELPVIGGWINVYPLLPMCRWYIRRKCCQAFLVAFFFGCQCQNWLFFQEICRQLWDAKVSQLLWFDEMWQNKVWGKICKYWCDAWWGIRWFTDNALL